MKQWIVVVVCVFSCVMMHSQREFKGGILAGPIASQISGDGLGGWDKIGFSAGAWVSVPFSEKSAMTISMKYITKGSRTKRDTLTFNMFAYHLNYIDVPVLYSYRVVRKKSSINFNIGPYAGVLLKQKVVANGYDYPVNPPFRAFDIGASLGVTWWLGEKFFFDLSSASSVLPTRPAPNATNQYSFYEKGNYNQTLQFMLGLRFGGDRSTE